MPSLRQLFLDAVGQTSSMPLMLEVQSATGIFIYTLDGDRYFDMNSGISVSSIGHCHPKVVAAIKEQANQYMHTMVYGEHVQQPQVKYAALLTNKLSKELNCIYYVMAGTEAVEVAMKLSRRYTRRKEIISCKGAYHGSTYGAEALRSDINYKMHFSPGVPGVRHIRFNDINDVQKIGEQTACVIMEAVQAESGVIPPDPSFLKAVESRCRETGTLFVLDEIQTGFGRTGVLFAHQKYGVRPDILLIGKSMGGGMPIAGVVSDKRILNSFTKNPALGHLTTFGGHPVSCAAAVACLETLLESEIIDKVEAKANLFRELLKHEIVKEIRNSGLMMAVELRKRKFLKHVIQSCFEQKLIVDYFLFNDRSFRLAPPLIISEEEIYEVCEIMNNAFDYAHKRYQ